MEYRVLYGEVPLVFTQTSTLSPQSWHKPRRIWTSRAPWRLVPCVRMRHPGLPVSAKSPEEHWHTWGAERRPPAATANGI